MPTYTTTGTRSGGPVFAHGEGATLTDTEGKEYLDMAAGIAVNVLGHSDAGVAAAVADQAAKVQHVSNLYHTEPYARLAAALSKSAPLLGGTAGDDGEGGGGGARVFFSNSGAEANEAAAKFATLHAAEAEGRGGQGPARRRTRFVAFEGGFHGRTAGALALTHKPAIRGPFANMLMREDNVAFAPFNDEDAAAALVDDTVAAVFVEPVQGEGGIHPARPRFLRRLRELCDAAGALLVFDEVQCGLGRSGRLWAHECYGVRPDLLTAAKPLAGGLPMGACLVAPHVVAAVPPGRWAGAHGSTFAAGPLVCRAAEEVLARVHGDPSFLARAREVARVLDAGCARLHALHPDTVVDVRSPPKLGEQGFFRCDGAGARACTAAERAGAPNGGQCCMRGGESLMVGLELSVPVAPVVEKAAARGVLLISAGEHVLRLTPPLVLTEQEARRCLDVLGACVAEAEREAAQAREDREARNEFAAAAEHRRWLAGQAALPKGFRCGTASLSYRPPELAASADGLFEAQDATMTVTLLVPDAPTPRYAAVFTRNALAGAPVVVGRGLIPPQQAAGEGGGDGEASNVDAQGEARTLGAIVINNKVANVNLAGIDDALAVTAAVEDALGLGDGGGDGGEEGRPFVLPCSTGVIGWRLPVGAMCADAVPRAAGALQAESALPAAAGIMTTDVWPKARRAEVAGAHGASVVGIAKGAGMIEPNMATMLGFVLTDLDVPRAFLQAALGRVAARTFNGISIDGDQSTSDTVVAVASGAAPFDAADAAQREAFEAALGDVCGALASDIVRNGEGVRHVVRVRVSGAGTAGRARAVGKAVVNSPLVKTAVAGNDPNVGRIVGAVGSYLGNTLGAGKGEAMMARCELKLWGTRVFANGDFELDDAKDRALSDRMKAAELPAAEAFLAGDLPTGTTSPAGGAFPAHERHVEVSVAFDVAREAGDDADGGAATVIGADLTHEYVSVNAARQDSAERTLFG